MIYTEKQGHGKESEYVKRDGGFYTGSLTNGERLYAFSFIIPSSELAKLAKGTKYKLHPLNNDAAYQWIVPVNVLFEW